MINKRKNVFIIIDRIFTLDGKEKTIGGIQTYLATLCGLIFKEYDIKPIILQQASIDFQIELDTFKVHGYVCKNKKFSRELLDKIKNYQSSSDLLLIWGSDQYSIKQTMYKSINIQHGIGFDTEADNRGIRAFMVKHGMSSMYKFLQRYRALKLYETSEKCVCVDYNFQNWYRTYRSKSEQVESYVIPNFTGSLKFEEIDIKLRNNTTNNVTRIVYARRFVKRRGVDIALSVARKILAEHNNVEFYFAGGGPLAHLVDDFVKLNPNAFITSYKSDQSLQFHQQFDIAIVPSIGSEGTSLSLLEAMGAGCAVIASDVGGMTNIVLDGFNGVMVKPSTSEFYDALENLVINGDSRRKIAKAGWETATSTFSLEKWSASWIRLLNQS
ncbi:glycosyltransferase family 4 protein [Vibrio kanaloae]|uniref:glycosyltransferase family 4 protein n=1 Tax=Vibrio kanaloae TaxID=170673 RepID=UPI000989182E|nr:glycosyltransferase family 4 protein [Vibrio kanaloae]QPK05348.1 glycosyltransferase family 4 protein [Vibrio kanaloae]